VRVYVRDTPDWVALGWEAQAVFLFVLRKVDRVGSLPLGRHGARGLAPLLHMPTDVVERALPLLLEDGCLELHGETLVVKNFVQAQEAVASGPFRNREWRARARGERLAEIKGNETKRLDPETKRLANETERDAARRRETERDSVPCLSVPCRAEKEHVVQGHHDPGPRLVLIEGSTASPQGALFTVPTAGAKAAPKQPWGYDADDPEFPPRATPRELAAAVLDFLNRQAGREFAIEPPADEHVRLVKGLASRNYTERQIRLVVWWKTQEWKADPKMGKFLRPSTLFAPANFVEYLEEASRHWKAGEPDGRQTCP